LCVNLTCWKHFHSCLQAPDFSHKTFFSLRLDLISNKLQRLSLVKLFCPAYFAGASVTNIKSFLTVIKLFIRHWGLAQFERYNLNCVVRNIFAQ